MSTDHIRPAEPRDIPALLGLVQELADYEREPDAVEATPELFAATLFPTEGAPTAGAGLGRLHGFARGLGGSTGFFRLGILFVEHHQGLGFDCFYRG